MQINQFTENQVKSIQASFIAKVYNWMCLALVITGAVSYWVVNSPNIYMPIISNRILFFGLIIAELAAVGYLSARLNKITSELAVALFVGYAALNGLTFSVIFLAYTASSIASTFLITAGTFGVMSAYGYFTKKDLTSIGNLAFTALIGLIIASLVNLFLKSTMLYWIATYVGVLVFVGLTAYDTQKIKEMALNVSVDAETEKKGAIMGALTLYLDFINLFIYMLRLFGSRD